MKKLTRNLDVKEAVLESEKKLQNEIIQTIMYELDEKYKKY